MIFDPSGSYQWFIPCLTLWNSIIRVCFCIYSLNKYEKLLQYIDLYISVKEVKVYLLCMTNDVNLTHHSLWLWTIFPVQLPILRTKTILSYTKLGLCLIVILGLVNAKNNLWDYCAAIGQCWRELESLMAVQAPGSVRESQAILDFSLPIILSPPCHVCGTVMLQAMQCIKRSIRANFAGRQFQLLPTEACLNGIGHLIRHRISMSHLSHRY